jgi:uncharacterized protein
MRDSTALYDLGKRTAIMADNDQGPVGVSAATTPMTQDEKNMCVLAHLLAIFTGFIAPLIIWLLKKDTSPVVGQHAVEVLNFEITIAIAGVCSGLLVFVFIGFLLLPAIMIFNVVNLIMGAMAAKDGRLRPYPFSLHLLK